LCKRTINDEAIGSMYKLDEEFTLSLLINICHLNAQVFKKVVIVSNFINKILENVDIDSCNDLDQANHLKELWDKNYKMVLKKPKVMD
jgi:hypothetical protein